ncbi:Ig domain-containing protein [Demequina sp. NBRC 110055]|uniref:Ig domain-containing protein n=1 Tax=Demequina sp. NBRC 110055 TaxID=1570344 RepID=UPI001F28D1C3|nr:Ig domain-containing protein [Demequina sp. NBRC 110055]
MSRTLSPLTAIAAATAAMVALAPAASAASLGVDDVPDNAPLEIDDGSTTRSFGVATAGVVTHASITLDFQKTDDPCLPPDDGEPYFQEIKAVLESPAGTSVVLIDDDRGAPSYGDVDVPGERVQVTLDDEASAAVGSTDSGIPVSGTFRPAEPLAAFDGEQAAGTWLLTLSDTSGSDPLCYYGATLDLDILEPPRLALDELPDAVVGQPYEATLSPDPDRGPATDFSLAGGTLPRGLELDSATGTITGTPTSDAVDATVDVVVTGPGGVSEAQPVTIAVIAAPSLSGPATAVATAGQAFAYTPDFEPGDPAADVSIGAGMLPDGLVLDPATGAISGTPTTAGEAAFTLEASNDVGSSTLDVTVSVAPGAVAALELDAEATTVDQGASLTFAPRATDAFGNVVALDPGDVVLSSDVASDVVDGLTVTFPHASPHTVTATHAESGSTAAVVIEVQAAGPGGVSGVDEPAQTGTGDVSGVDEPAQTGTGDVSGVDEPAQTGTGDVSGAEQLAQTGPGADTVGWASLAVALMGIGAGLVTSRLRQ